MRTTGDFAKEEAAKLLERLAFQMARTLKSQSTTEVHDLRVAIRRFVRVLIVLKPCFPRDESRRIRRKLKKIMIQAGSVRDLDIAMQLVATLTPSGSLGRQFRSEREETARELAVLLKSWLRRRYTAKWRLALKSECAADGFCANSVVTTAREILPRMTKEYFRHGEDAARDKAPAEELHRFRIAAKNFRYTLDLFAPVYGSSTLGLIRQLKGIQKLLGEFNDCATVRRMVSRYRGSQETSASLKKRQRKKAEQFQKNWTAAYSGAATARQWTVTLRHVGDQIRGARKPPARSTPAPSTLRRLASV
ncbi:MAG TPA: CHAD domain-containing protein [Bryobacteraceae bacterium]|nr:CHAD domain-containing protein [Bryobacteraceae bacterium]